jgi:hypothetical protein
MVVGCPWDGTSGLFDGVDRGFNGLRSQDVRYLGDQVITVLRVNDYRNQRCFSLSLGTSVETLVFRNNNRLLDSPIAQSHGRVGEQPLMCRATA